ncbi:MAG: DUF362 domain-containing protein [Calditrichaceae bacterium]
MFKKRELKIIIILTFICVWLSWDLYQASVQADQSDYPLYKMVDEFDAISSATTKVSIKPNIVDPEPPGSGEVTDVRVIKALIKIIDEIDPGKMEIVIGEGSPRPMNYEMDYQSKFSSPQWETLWDKSGYQDLLTDSYLEGINLRLSNLNGSPSVNPWQDLVAVEIAGGGQADAQNGKYFIHKDVLNADVFITVPVMKIHTPGVTIALKNQIGLAPSSFMVPGPIRKLLIYPILLKSIMLLWMR